MVVAETRTSDGNGSADGCQFKTRTICLIAVGSIVPDLQLVNRTG